MKLSTLILILLAIPIFLLANDGIYEEMEKEIEITGEQPLTLILDIDAGTLQTERNDQDSIVRVRMTYNREYSSAEVDYNEHKNKLRIHMNRDRWNKFHNDDHNQDAECFVYLPNNIDMVIDSRLKAGELDMVIGGLRILEFDFNMWAGEANIDFDLPNLVVMDMLDIDTRVGEFNLDHLGNAHFERADINGGIGEINVDFTGDIQNESRAKVDLDIGEATIVLPGNVGLMMSIGGSFSFMSSKNIDHELMKRGRRYYNENFDSMENKFFVRVTPGLGELNIEVD